jgi:Ca2+-binding RTX toxin-like protein
MMSDLNESLLKIAVKQVGSNAAAQNPDVSPIINQYFDSTQPNTVVRSISSEGIADDPVTLNALESLSTEVIEDIAATLVAFQNFSPVSTLLPALGQPEILEPDPTSILLSFSDILTGINSTRLTYTTTLGALLSGLVTNIPTYVDETSPERYKELWKYVNTETVGGFLIGGVGRGGAPGGDEILDTREVLFPESTGVTIQISSTSLGTVNISLSTTFDVLIRDTFDFSPGGGGYGDYEGYPTLTVAGVTALAWLEEQGRAFDVPFQTQFEVPKLTSVSFAANLASNGANLGNSVLEGTDGADTLVDLDTQNDSENTTINGLDGADNISLGWGNDVAYGGLQNDSIRGGNGRSTIYGNEGNDTILPSLSGVSDVYGGDGDDLIDMRGNEDNLPSRTDYLRGEAGNDTIYLSASNNGDYAYGGQGNDTLISQSGVGGNHFLYGGPGNDIIHSNGGDDVSVGAGIDVITYNKKMYGTNPIPMTIRTFENNIDKFEILDAPGLILRSTQSGTSALVQLQRNGSWDTLAEFVYFSASNLSLTIAGTSPNLRYIFS